MFKATLGAAARWGASTFMTALLTISVFTGLCYGGHYMWERQIMPAYDDALMWLTAKRVGPEIRAVSGEDRNALNELIAELN